MAPADSMLLLVMLCLLDTARHTALQGGLSVVAGGRAARRRGSGRLLDFARQSLPVNTSTIPNPIHIEQVFCFVAAAGRGSLSPGGAASPTRTPTSLCLHISLSFGFYFIYVSVHGSFVRILHSLYRLFSQFIIFSNFIFVEYFKFVPVLLELWFLETFETHWHLDLFIMICTIYLFIFIHLFHDLR